MGMAIEIAKQRRLDSYRRKLSEKNNGDRNVRSWDFEIDGAAAELVVAKSLNRFYEGPVGNFKGGDVGDLQVRHTSKEGGRLIVRDEDSDNAYFILVTGVMPTYNIVGYIKGIEAKKKSYLYGPGGNKPAFFVPQDDLTTWTSKN